MNASPPRPSGVPYSPMSPLGPGDTPWRSFVTGGFGPTTAGRMDSCVARFQRAGGGSVMPAKGNRSRAVRDACKAYGGFYLGGVGGPAARLARGRIREVDVPECPEPGMEAVWHMRVEDFPASIITDDKGNGFYDGLE